MTPTISRVLVFGLLGYLLVGIGHFLEGEAAGLAGMAALSLVGAWWLLQVLRDPAKNWSLSDLHGAALLFWYFGGTGYSLLVGDPYELELSDPADRLKLLGPSSFIVLTSATCALLARPERRVWQPVMRKIVGSRLEPSPVLLAFLVALWVLTVYLVQSGEIGLRNVGAKEDSKALATLIVAFGSALVGVLGWLAGQPHRGFGSTLLVAGYVPLTLLILLGQGRLPLLMHLATFAVAFVWARGHWLTRRQVAGVLALVVPAFVAGELVFQAMRLDPGYIPEATAYDNTPLTERLKGAAERLGSDLDSVLEDQAETLPTRLFFHGYLMMLMNAPQTPPPALGLNGLAQIVVGIPRRLLPTKVDIIEDLGGFDEDRGMDFGIPHNIDLPSTVVTGAYIDFLWLGWLGAALMVAGTGVILAWISRLLVHPIFRLMFVASVLVAFAQIEMSYFAVVMAVLRLGAVFLPLSAGLWLVERLLGVAPIVTRPAAGPAADR